MIISKNKFTLIINFIVVALLFSHCQPKLNRQIDLENPDLMHQSQALLEEVIVYDIFSPPVASRIYAYANLAAYEALVPGYPDYHSMSGKLNELDTVTIPEKNQEYNFSIASLQAFLEVGRSLTFSENKINDYQQQLMDSLRQALPAKVFQASIDFGSLVAQDIIAYANADNYNQTRGFRYTIMEEPGTWQPTPPAYMDAIEPFWNQVRPFVLDSATQFVPPPPTPFSLEKGSKFYQELMEVYETGNNLTEEQKEIASFWDCNPYVMHTMGHAMYATKKITPGGHWMGIVQMANKQSGANLMQSVQAYALVAITLADAFISCWDEKYRSNLIRPETVIDAHIDDQWDPLLQTPPFPEYTSGHSVVSKAAATMLTHLYGDQFTFADSVEVKYGLPVRNFESFHHAADEAAISRLYGGIHYMPAISHGVAQGTKVGDLLVKKLVENKQVAVRAE